MSLNEKFVVCPFNKSHVVSRLRIQYHLIKCKKHYPHSKKIVCPYDATEYIDPDLFMQHLSQCKKNRRLDVTEEFKKKQFESVQHGCVNNQPFVMPQHVEITDEWDVASNASNNSHDSEITRDERNAFKLRRQSSNAVRKACNYIPLIPHPIGRGRVSEAVRDYLNRYEHPLKPESQNDPVLLADNDYENEIYDDADDQNSEICNDTDDRNSEIGNGADDRNSEIYNGVGDHNSEICNGADDRNGEMCGKSYSNSSVEDGHNLAINKVSDGNNNPCIMENNRSSYYRPSIAKGRSIIRSGGGRGIPIGRGITFETNNTITSLSESFDHVLKQIISNRMSVDDKYKSDVSSSSSDSPSSETCVDKFKSEKEKFALTLADSSIDNPTCPVASPQLCDSKQTNLSSSSKNTLNEPVLTSRDYKKSDSEICEENKVNSLSDELECKYKGDVSSSSSHSASSKTRVDKRKSDKERFALTLADISIGNPTCPVASPKLCGNKQTNLSSSSKNTLNEPLLTSSDYKKSDSKICKEDEVNASSDVLECKTLKKESSSENTISKKCDDMNNKLRPHKSFLPEPEPDYSIGRGKILRPLDYN